MPRSAAGLHLENHELGTAADRRQRVIPARGSVTLLHMTLGSEYPKLRQLHGPDLLIHCRCYLHNWYTTNPEAWADECLAILRGVPGFLDDPNTVLTFENEQDLQCEGAPWGATWDKPWLTYEQYTEIWDWQRRVRERFLSVAGPIKTAIATGPLAGGHDMAGYSPDNEYNHPEFKELLKLCTVITSHAYAPDGGWGSTPTDEGYWHLIRGARPPRYRENVQGKPSIGPWGDLGGVFWQYRQYPQLITETGYFGQYLCDAAKTDAGMAQMHNGFREWSKFKNFLGATMFIWWSDGANWPTRIKDNTILVDRLPELHQYMGCNWPYETTGQPQQGGSMDKLEAALRDYWKRQGVEAPANGADGFWDYALAQARQSKLVYPAPTKDGNWQNHDDPEYARALTVPPLWAKKGVWEVKEGFPPFA